MFLTLLLLIQVLLFLPAGSLDDAVAVTFLLLLLVLVLVLLLLFLVVVVVDVVVVAFAAVDVATVEHNFFFRNSSSS